MESAVASVFTFRTVTLIYIVFNGHFVAVVSRLFSSLIFVLSVLPFSCWHVAMVFSVGVGLLLWGFIV